MQNTRSPHARRIFLALAAALGLSLLFGCKSPAITNLTPTALPENPSHIYTISARVHPEAAGFVPSSIVTRIVIDGQIFPMTQSPLGADIYTFDYQLPAGRDEVAYYFLTDYKYERNGIIYPAEEYTPVIHTRIASHYVLSMMANRGPAGSQVSIVGRGFGAQDTVTFDGAPVRTVFNSTNALTFFVPAVAAARNYAVAISGPDGSSPVGTFRVDPTDLTVSPTRLDLATGQGQELTFTLPSPAPAGGQLLDVTTDIPESVIMPEVTVPAGSQTVTITVTGGKPGSGSLVLKGFGSSDITIPVTVK